MASSKLKLFRSPLPPAVGERGLPIKQPTATATKRAFSPFQVKSEQVQILQAPKAITVSRRDIIQYAATKSLVGFALLFTEPAEARVGRLQNKKKAMEKLREKSRVSKPKGEAPPAQKSPDDKSLPTFPLPPQGGRIARLVEATHNNI